jgi:hypothetical protein
MLLMDNLQYYKDGTPKRNVDGDEKSYWKCVDDGRFLQLHCK